MSNWSFLVPTFSEMTAFSVTSSCPAISSAGEYVALADLAKSWPFWLSILQPRRQERSEGRESLDWLKSKKRRRRKSSWKSRNDSGEVSLDDSRKQPVGSAIRPTSCSQPRFRRCFGAVFLFRNLVRLPRLGYFVPERRHARSYYVGHSPGRDGREQVWNYPATQKHQNADTAAPQMRGNVVWEYGNGGESRSLIYGGKPLPIPWQYPPKSGTHLPYLFYRRGWRSCALMAAMNVPVLLLGCRLGEHGCLPSGYYTRKSRCMHHHQLHFSPLHMFSITVKKKSTGAFAPYQGVHQLDNQPTPWCKARLCNHTLSYSSGMYSTRYPNIPTSMH